MYTPVLAVEPQWIIALCSLTSALIALGLGLGLRDWVTRPRVRLVLRAESDPEATATGSSPSGW